MGARRVKLAAADSKIIWNRESSILTKDLEARWTWQTKSKKGSMLRKGSQLPRVDRVTSNISAHKLTNIRRRLEAVYINSNRVYAHTTDILANRVTMSSFTSKCARKALAETRVVALRV